MVQTRLNNPKDSAVSTAISVDGLSEEHKVLATFIINQVNEQISIQIKSILAAKDEQIKKLEHCTKDLEEQISIMKEEINKKEDLNKNLNKRVSSLEHQVDRNSQYERRDCLIISGNLPPATPNENCNAIVRKLLKDQTHLVLNETDISTAHRIGNKPLENHQDKRSIIFKLCRRDLKKDILNSCRQYKPNFYINEQLTPTRRSIMFVLRKAKQHSPQRIYNARTSEGNITLFLPSNQPGKPTRRVTVNTRSELDDVLMQQIKKTSSDFISNWPEH